MRGIVPWPGFFEPASAISHLAGAVLFLVLGVLLVRRGRGDRTRMAYLAVYSATCVFLLAMSGVYHMMQKGGGAREVMARLDHSAIFVLIAGSFTPVHGILFHGWKRWLPLVLIWGLAICGLTLKTIFFEGFPEWLGLTFYLGLGWLGAASGTALAWRYGFRFVEPLLYGGIAYSVGAACEFFRWPVLAPGVIQAHEVFHLAVLVGMVWQWLFVWQIARMRDPELPSGGAAISQDGGRGRRRLSRGAREHSTPA